MINLPRYLFGLCALISAFQLSALEDKSPLQADEVKQLIVAVSKDWEATTATLYTFEKRDDGWHQTELQSQVNLGRTGLAWGKGLHPEQTGLSKKEGDGKAPAGIFDLGIAFGYLKSVNTAMPYQQMSATDYCMDVNGSPLYNQIVDQAVVGKEATKGSSEAMRLDIHHNQNMYKKGLVVKHNPANVSGQGSCIFMHLWKGQGKPTAGCTSMPENVMDRLLAWLDKAQHPLYVALPEAEYLAKKQQWALPDITSNHQ